MSKLAFFDFDGTITTDDSLIKFIRFAVGDFKFSWGMFLLSPILVAYKLKLIPNDKAKQNMLMYFFKGIESKTFYKMTSEYALTHIDTIVRPKAMEKIVWHQKEGHQVVIVSASIKCWLEPWCKKHNIELIATELEVVDNKLTGKFSTKNCYGKEKENRIKQTYDLSQYSYIYAYGDSSGDKALLALANESFYKPFRD